ncbi:MAG: chemotaxis protein CheA [Candidatus Caenarcaniphilales bacterium]|nr:chemotaxis protein CheA [Candidatus Caenarcaniphilales bacterium]
MQEYRDLFFDEVNSSLDALSELLSKLRHDPNNKNFINEIFRIIHTVKGMAATMTYNSIAKLCHKFEETLDAYRKNPEPVSEDILDILQRALDTLFNLVELISDSAEEPQSCYVLADKLSKELENLVERSSEKKKKELLINQSAPTKVEVSIEFQKDCAMPCVRAFMATQLLERSGELLSSEPASSDFMDNPDLLSQGFKLIFKPKESLDTIHNKLQKISEVKLLEIKVLEPSDLSAEQSEMAEAVAPTPQNNPEAVKNPFQNLSEKQINELKAGKFKLFRIKLMLSDEVLNPAEQFQNIVKSFNDYLGQIVESYPSLAEIELRVKEHQAMHPLFEIVDRESKIDLHQSRELFKLEFILLINADPKSILDFMQDACELSKIQVDEIKLPADSTNQPTDTGTVDSNLAQIQSDLAKLSHESSEDTNHKNTHDVKTSFVRVNVAVLESLMNSVGELVINHNRLQSALGDVQDTETRSIMQYLHQVTTKIQQQVMSARMVPINQVFSRFPRFIRDIARSLGKLVELEIIGGETEIDRLMIDELNEILTHLVRNAIDHGIETADQRERFHKSSRGNIKLQAYSQGNNVFITISDDGRGIDTDNVKRKAIERGLLSLERAEAMSKEEIMDLIFATGFSTAAQVSDLSGRGVGMDVVKSRVSSLGGQVSIDSLITQGTTVKLSIPSTISIIQALIISHQGGWYAIPLSDIREIIQIRPLEQIRKLSNCEVMVMHNQTIPVIKLEDYLMVENVYCKLRSEDDTALVIMVEHHEKPIGIIVDSLICQQEVVIKPISNRANMQGLINGATVFGNGRVAMILNTERIIELYRSDKRMQYSPWGTERSDDDSWHFVLGK